MPRNYNKGQLVYVTMGSVIKYAFNSRVDSNRRSALGQFVIDAAMTDVQGLILGANSPKPPRAVKKFATGTESSYFSHDKGVSLKNDGWKIIPAKPRRQPSGGDLSTTYKITMNGITYAYNAPDIPSGTNFAGVGNLLTEVDANDNTDLFVWGAEFPKPPRFSITNNEGNKFSSYIDPSDINTARGAGVKVYGGVYTTADFNEKYLGVAS